MIRPVAGELINPGDVEGIRTPLAVLLTSSIAELSGGVPVALYADLRIFVFLQNMVDTRDYITPAIVGAKGAKKFLSAGDLVRLDGNRVIIDAILFGISKHDYLL